MQEIISSLIKENDTKIVLCVLDGLGGLPLNGKTELEAASTPNLDKLVSNSSAGLHTPVGVGITPGSGAAHLGLFGYDPVKYQIGRGVLEALGLGIQLGPKDIAVRGNFSTVKYKGNTPIVTDRRAGRISTEENRRIINKLSGKLDSIENAKVTLYSGLEHRFVVVFTFPEILEEESDCISDTDPQKEGVSPIVPSGDNELSRKVARVLNGFVEQSSQILKDENHANYPLLRGISLYPNLIPYSEVYGLRACCIATYPMYKGVSKLVGMDILEVSGNSIKSELDTLKNNFDKYDFFFIHIKKTDSYGEDGNFEGKVGVIEEFDSLVPQILELKPDVFSVTGDHSTPAIMKSHSWHPVPILINSRYHRAVNLDGFYESECNKGDLGIIKSVEIMPLLLAHSDRLSKYGA